MNFVLVCEGILCDPKLQGKLSNTKVSTELRLLEDFTARVHANTHDGFVSAVYGEADVEQAVEMDAVDKLLLCDQLFRHAQVFTSCVRWQPVSFRWQPVFFFAHRFLFYSGPFSALHTFFYSLRPCYYRKARH